MAITVDNLENGKRVYFVSDNGMIGKKYGVLDDPRPWDGGTVVMVSPAAFSFIEDQSTRGKVYEKFHVKDGDKMRWIVDIIMGVG